MYNRIISLLLIPVGVFLLLGNSIFSNLILRLVLQLKENSYLAQIWEVTPIPLYFEFYAYNWTNPEDITVPGVKPKFEEIGPFVFKETRVKENIKWHDNDSVSYQQNHMYTYEREKSGVDMDTPFTTVNPVLLGLIHKMDVRNWYFWLRAGFELGLQQLDQGLVLTSSFVQYLFDGYPDKVIKLAYLVNTLPHPFTIPKIPNGDKFALLYGKNCSSNVEGVFTISNSFETLGSLEKWNYSNRTPFYDGTCGSLKGASMGEIFSPEQNGDSISVFIPDICRPLRLDFEKEVIVGGIKGRKYSAGLRTLDNGTQYPENKCLCPGECLPSGAMNISTCKYDAPAYFSLPHFYLADEGYLKGVEILSPNASRDELFYIIEPTTGSILEGVLRLQINLFVKPVPGIRIFDDVPEVMIPVLWFQGFIKAPASIVTLLTIFSYVPDSFKLLGIFMIFTGIYLNRQLLKSLLKKKSKVHNFEMSPPDTIIPSSNITNIKEKEKESEQSGL